MFTFKTCIRLIYYLQLASSFRLSTLSYLTLPTALSLNSLACLEQKDTHHSTHPCRLPWTLCAPICSTFCLLHASRARALPRNRITVGCGMRLTLLAPFLPFLDSTKPPLVARCALRSFVPDAFSASVNFYFSTVYWTCIVVPV